MIRMKTCCVQGFLLVVIMMPLLAQRYRRCGAIKQFHRLGESSLKQHHYQRAISAFTREEQYAEDNGDITAVSAACAKLATAYFLAKQYPQSIAWVRLALARDPDATDLKAVLMRDYRALRSSTWRKHGGMYAQYAGRGFWNILRVRPGPRGSTFSLSLYRILPGWRKFGPSAIGDISSRAQIHGDKAIIHGDAEFPGCTIVVRFAHRGAKLAQSGNCGFGYGVAARGDFWRLLPTTSQWAAIQRFAVPRD